MLLVVRGVKTVLHKKTHLILQAQKHQAYSDQTYKNSKIIRRNLFQQSFLEDGFPGNKFHIMNRSKHDQKKS